MEEVAVREKTVELFGAGAGNASVGRIQKEQAVNGGELLQADVGEVGIVDPQAPEPFVFGKVLRQLVGVATAGDSKMLQDHVRQQFVM